jgi:hypothetical protein
MGTGRRTCWSLTPNEKGTPFLSFPRIAPGTQYPLTTELIKSGLFNSLALLNCFIPHCFIINLYSDLEILISFVVADIRTLLVLICQKIFLGFSPWDNRKRANWVFSPHNENGGTMSPSR